MLVFGAAVFSFLFNLCYLAVGKDVEVLRAYLVLKHTEEFSQAEIMDAIETLSRLLPADARSGGRPILCEDDFVLIRLHGVLPEPSRAALAGLLVRKTGRDSGWMRTYLEGLPLARSPFFMPELELTLLYYTWVIEIATLVFLSQSLRRRHVQEYLHGLIRKPAWFVPVTSLVLWIPLWRWVTLAFASPGPGLAVLSGTAAVAGSLLLFLAARARMTPQSMNDVGLYILISSLFVQLLTMMGDPDMVYPLFAAPEMQGVRYATWFILICLPLTLLEKWFRARKGVRESPEGQDIP